MPEAAQDLPVGSVAEEAARLIDAFAMLGRSPDRGSPRSGPRDTAPAGARDTAPAGAPSACPECGSTGGATPAACRVCPVCQGIALLRSVRPETIDWLADLATSVATSLHSLAAQTRAPAGPSAGGADAPGRAGRATVQDIPVDDERDGAAP